MPKQSRKRASRKAHRVIELPQARGKTVEKVELDTASGFRCISIRFQDNTDLTVMIDPAVKFRADYSMWHDGNQKVLKRWPQV